MSPIRLRDQVVKMLKASSYMRYPMVDADGYRYFQMVGPLDWRSRQTFPIDTAYGERGSGFSVAPNTNDPTAVGFAKQMFEDNWRAQPELPAGKPADVRQTRLRMPNPKLWSLENPNLYRLVTFTPG